MNATGPGNHISCRQRGVTLVELLVALVLLSFVMSAVYGALRMGLRSWEAVQLRSGENAEARVARNLLRQQLDTLVPLSLPDATLGQRLAFEGDRAGFRFVGAWSHPARSGGLHLIEVGQGSGSSRKGLVLRLSPSALHETDWRRAGADVLERELLQSRDEARFAYYGKPRGSALPSWYDRWDDAAERYPQLIRIEAPDGWPPLLLPVRVAGSAAGAGK